MKATNNPARGSSALLEAQRLVQVVSFRVNGQLLGVPVSIVQEVLNGQTFAPVPLARREIAGLLNLRGQIVTAIDLRCRLGLEPRLVQQPCMNVVIRHAGESFSLLVDEVGDVLPLDGSEQLPPPRTLDANWKGVTAGVFRLDEELLVILDVERLLTFR